MIKSKGWDWKIVKDDDNCVWKNPSIESYYLLNRWSSLNFKNFLDLGCGLGRHSMLFYEYGFDVTACDITPFCINYLKTIQEKRNITFPVIECDMLNMPFKNNSFDCIYAYHVLSHTNLEGFKKLFKKVYDILDNDGEIFFDVLSKKCDLFTTSGYPKLDSNTILSKSENELDVPHICFDYEELVNILSDFILLDVKEVRSTHNNRLDNREVHFFIRAKKK